MKPAAVPSFCRLLVALAGMLVTGPVCAQEPLRVSARGVGVELRGVSKTVSPEAVRVIEDQLGLAGDSVVSAPLADDLAYFLQRRYLQLGHSEARVDWELAAGAIVLTVSEGPRLLIGTVTFTGAEGIASGDFEAFLTRPTRERARALTRSLPFVEADVRAGVDLVLRHLQAQGYLEASADDPDFSPVPTGDAMDITVALKPGPQSVFGEVALGGDISAVSPELRSSTMALTGQPFNEVALETARGALKGGLQERGHFAAEVSAESGAPQHHAGSAIRVPVSLVVNPGKRYAVGAVRVDEGLSRGASRVARSVFSAATAQTYAPNAIDLLHRRALDTGLFSRLEVDPVVTGDGALDLRVTGEEAKPRTLGVYGGYESLLGPILGLEVRHVNYLDTGNAVGLRAEFRGTGGEGGLQWTDPAIFGSRWSLGTGVSWESFTFADYDRQTAAWRTTMTRRLTRRITAEAYTTLSYNEVNTDVLTPEELGPGEYTTASGGLRLTFDYRDHPLLARDGWLVALAAEGGGIDGDEPMSFVRGELAVGWYQPLAERWRFSLGARARAIFTPAEVGEFPIDLRVFNGGASSVRSFAERELGPMSNDGETPLGGLASGVVSAEVAYEVIRNLELAAFADAGSIGEDMSAFFSVDDLRYGVGLGLRYRLPVGPLRVDYGVNPDRREGESFGALHVTFGFAF
jgi:outer membrane protein insertion porin family